MDYIQNQPNFLRKLNTCVNVCIANIIIAQLYYLSRYIFYQSSINPGLEVFSYLLPPKPHPQKCIQEKILRLSTRPISTGQLNTLLYFHLRPIYLVIYQGS